MTGEGGINANLPDATTTTVPPRCLHNTSAALGSKRCYRGNYQTFEGAPPNDEEAKDKRLSTIYPIEGAPPNDEAKDKRGFNEMRRMLGVIGVFCALVFVAVSILMTKTNPGATRAPSTGHMSQDLEWSDGFFKVDEADSTRSDVLAFAASNEYGEYDQRALVMYGLEMVVEPHRETKISVLRTSQSDDSNTSMRFHWLLLRSDENGVPTDEVEIDSIGGTVATVTLTQAGGTYALLVTQLRADGSVAAEGRAKISCKYVRRELRQLTKEDSTAFFAAMQEFFTISEEEGKLEYGEAYTGSGYIAATHNSVDVCYHNGMHFLPAHAAFDLWVERTLQMIDPKVSLPIWDFMLDAAILGTNWPSSELFGPDMFGSAIGTAENSFQIKDGWFANISSLYDPTDAISTGTVNTSHNPFGYVSARFDYQDLPGVTRTHSFCGLQGKAQFALCNVFTSCFDDYSTLYDWATCMETQVHASMHGTLGGGFNCNTDMDAFHAENPQYSAGLLTFVLEYVLANKWPSNKLMADYNECDTTCERGQPEACGCNCTTDPFEWRDHEVYDYMVKEMETLYGRFHGDLYVHNDTSAEYPLGFTQNGVRLDQASTLHIMRLMMVIGCEPGSIGAMCGGAAPKDPIFWVLHPAFEKALHILQLSPGYRDTYDMTWVNGSCYGSGYNDQVPFTEQALGLGDGSEMLTVEEVMALVHPSNANLPYVYDDIGGWGTCTDWDPCPECST